MNKEQLSDAYTLANYMTMESLENELQDCLDCKKSGDDYPCLDKVIKVIRKAIKISK